MEADLVGTQHLGSKLCHHLSIDSYDTSLYELVGLAAAAHSCICKELVQTYRLVRVEMLLFILDALLKAVLGVGVVVGCTLALVERLVAVWLVTIASRVGLVAKWLVAV